MYAHTFDLFVWASGDEDSAETSLLLLALPFNAFDLALLRRRLLLVAVAAASGAVSVIVGASRVMLYVVLPCYATTLFHAGGKAALIRIQ